MCKHQLKCSEQGKSSVWKSDATFIFEQTLDSGRWAFFHFFKYLSAHISWHWCTETLACYLSTSRIFLSVCSSTSEKSWWVCLTFSCSWIPSTDRLCRLSGPVMEAMICTSSKRLSACSSWDWSCPQSSWRRANKGCVSDLCCYHYHLVQFKQESHVHVRANRKCKNIGEVCVLPVLFIF